MPYADPAEQREFQRRWMAARRVKWLKKFGNACKRCGSSEKLEFDHLDRSKKVSHRIWSWTDQRIAAELQKCQLLCRPCHLDKTADELYAPRLHGTRTMYTHGCRCDDRRTAARTALRLWRQKIGGRNLADAAKRQSRLGAVAARRAHNPKVIRAIRIGATT